MRPVDLHVHSTRSDGTFTPTQLVDYAIEKGLKAIALTDHDTVDGIREITEYADTLRKNSTNPELIPEIIPGIEFSTEYEGRDIHIVGLYIDMDAPSFCEHLKAFVESRDNRNKKMCQLLQQEGIDITYEKLIEEFPNSVITRAHYAKYLLTHGYIKSLKEAFDRYVGDHCKCFVPREKVTPAQAVELILNAGGIPILAHPILYRMSDARLEKLVAELKEVGLLGIEAIYSTYSLSEERQIRKLAAKYHLLLSGGSDFHGDNKPGLDLGTGYGKLYVDEAVLDAIKGCRKNLLFSDMDGTLLLSDNTISQNMKNELDRITSLGHKLVLNSGRPLASILEVKEALNLDYKNMYISAFNGAVIYDCDARENILEKKLDYETLKTIIAECDALNVHVQGYTDGEIVCRGNNEELEFYRRRIHMPLKIVSDLPDAFQNGSYKLLAISLNDKESLIKLKSLVMEKCGSKVQTLFSNDMYLEILPIDAGKGQALDYLTSYFPMPHSHTYAAGDAENDISMLLAAHTGIAMQNAESSVKEIADIITQKTNNEDGLLEIISTWN